jgi:hypothetical protein
MMDGRHGISDLTPTIQLYYSLSLQQIIAQLNLVCETPPPTTYLDNLPRQPSPLITPRIPSSYNTTLVSFWKSFLKTL